MIGRTQNVIPLMSPESSRSKHPRPLSSRTLAIALIVFLKSSNGLPNATTSALSAARRFGPAWRTSSRVRLYCVRERPWTCSSNPSLLGLNHQPRTQGLDIQGSPEMSLVLGRVERAAPFL